MLDEHAGRTKFQVSDPRGIYSRFRDGHDRGMCVHSQVQRRHVLESSRILGRGSAVRASSQHHMRGCLVARERASTLACRDGYDYRPTSGLGLGVRDQRTATLLWSAAMKREQSNLAPDRMTRGALGRIRQVECPWRAQ